MPLTVLVTGAPAGFGAAMAHGGTEPGVNRPEPVPTCQAQGPLAIERS